MVGVLRGTRKAGTEVMETITHTAHVAIRDTAEVGGDLEAAASGLVQGAIEAAKEKANAKGGKPAPKPAAPAKKVA